MVDASRITGRLFVGSAPEPSPFLARHFDVLVLCAEEYQPSSRNFPGLTVVHAGFDDGPGLDGRQEKIVEGAATIVRKELDKGKRVLVTCAQGRNRSGLVASLALMLPGRWPTPSCLSGREVIGLMKGRRGPGALTNEYFQKILKATG